jgi:hypothetical protein
MIYGIILRLALLAPVKRHLLCVLTGSGLGLLIAAALFEGALAFGIAGGALLVTTVGLGRRFLAEGKR